MRIKYPILLVFLFSFFSQGILAQSVAYKTLLKGFYDKDFPLVYPDQDEILQKAVLLDTREIEEYRVSHLDGAMWVGYEDFSLERVKDISKDQPVVVYCSIGARSQDIGKKLKDAGFKEVYNLYGGIFHWVNEEKPVYSNNLPTKRIHAYSKSWGIWLNKGEKVY
ncbi:rhodanese-like domain-containing protein [Shivajiella indica]|uniref:Rhodanese-like domain-containing protein n=1 Tax=Shivajiella indica TaxID=872115 RepID=A0ABW5BAE0_9BACT